MTTQIQEPVDVGASIYMHAWRQRISQADLGRAIGVTQATMSRKLRGHTPITVGELMTIARLLGVEPGDLLPRLDSNQEPSVYQQAQVRDVCEAPNVVHLDLWRERKAS